MMFGFSIRVSPSIGHLAGNLSRFAGDIRSAKGAMEQAVEEVIKPRIEENFASQSDSGIAWPPMHEATPFFPYRRYRDPGGNAPLLNVTGRLLRAALATERWTFDGQAGVMFVPMDTFRTSAAPYGEIQHEGGFTTGLGGHEIPARPFFSIDLSADLPPMEEIFSTWLGDRVMGAVSSGRGSQLYGTR